MTDRGEELKEKARAAGREAYRSCQLADHLTPLEIYRIRQKAYVKAYNNVIRRYHIGLHAKRCACRFMGVQMPGLPTFWSPCTSYTAGDPNSIFANGHSAFLVSEFAKAYLAGGRIYHSESPTEALTPMEMFAKVGMSITEEQFLNAVERIRLYRFRVDNPVDYDDKVTARWAGRLVSDQAEPRPWGRRRRAPES